MESAVRLEISGLVQGVFYRMSAKKKATELGLVGWVRNLDNSNVESYAEGEKTALEEYISWCRKGPNGAKVTDVSVEWIKPRKEDDSFEIIR